MEKFESVKMSYRSLAVQGFAAMSIAYLSSMTGIVFAWPSSNVANFVSNETVLARPMTTVDVSLLGSLTNIGAFLGTPSCGYFLNTLGRKKSAMMFGLPFVLTWAIISVTNVIPAILTATCLAGFGTAGQTVSSIYISEIAHESVRGALTSFIACAYFVGLLVSYTLGGLLVYKHVVYVQLSMAVLYVILVALLKDSPTYLMQKGREKEAAEAIAFYRQVSVTSKEVEIEIAKIKLQLDPRLAEMLDESDEPTVTKELIVAPPVEERKLSEWQCLKKSHSSIRALVTSLICMATMILMGNIPIQIYAETLFKEAVPSLDSNQCSIFLAIDMLVAGIGCSILIDYCGRKSLMVVTASLSSVCTVLLGLQIQYHFAAHWSLMVVTASLSSVCTVLLGLQIQYHFAAHWVTAFLIYVYNFIFNLGIAVIPYVLCAELFLPEVRGLCGSITMASGWAMNFITVVVFTPVVEQLGFAPLFYAFSAVGFAGALYCLYCLPETKGMSADAIQLLFLKKSKRKIKN